MKLLVTGGCGFIGSQFIRGWLKRYPNDIVYNVDCLTYAGSLLNLSETASHVGYRHIPLDISSPEFLDKIGAMIKNVDIIMHFAAETHVDRSLEDPTRFLKTNILGTNNILEFARTRNVPNVVLMSTDEVYGSKLEGSSFVDDKLNPSSPYSASKAGADLLALSYKETYDIPLTIVRSVNVFGPYQHPEKFIPLFIMKALSNEPMPLYGVGSQRRTWLYIKDCVDGLIKIINKTDRKAVYHLGSGNEFDNLRIAEIICDICERPHCLIKRVSDRPGHDFRYSLDWSNTSTTCSWVPMYSMLPGLEKTVSWIKENSTWVKSRIEWVPSFYMMDI